MRRQRPGCTRSHHARRFARNRPIAFTPPPEALGLLFLRGANAGIRAWPCTLCAPDRPQSARPAKAAPRPVAATAQFSVRLAQCTRRPAHQSEAPAEGRKTTSQTEMVSDAGLR